jgi:plasmid stabilization system protein ParE
MLGHTTAVGKCPPTTLRHIFDFKADDSKRYAYKVTQEITLESLSLEEFPRIGRVAPEVGDDNVREFSLYSYRIIYEIMNGYVYVFPVVHKRRDLKAEDTGK